MISFITIDFLAGSVAMLVALNIGIIPSIYVFNNPNLFSSISSYCKIMSYFTEACAIMYRWFMMFACVDRYIHTSINPSLQRFVNVRIAIRVILGIIIVSLILPIYYLIFADVQNNVCMFPNPDLRLFYRVFIILNGILPPLIMLISTLLIQHNLTLKRQRVARLRNIAQEQKENSIVNSRDQQAIVMLFVQVFVYIITNMPLTIILIYSSVTRDMIKPTNDVIIESFVSFIAGFFRYTYPALSFYLYTLASRSFRQEFIKVIKPLCICRQQQLLRSIRIQPTV